MDNHHLSDIVRTIQLTTVAQGVAAATDLTSGEVDMAADGGADGVRFIIPIGVITAGAVTGVRAQQDTATGMAAAADIAGSAQTVADDDDDKLFIIDIFRPRERFVRAVVDRATQNAVVGTIIAEVYRVRRVPVTQDATVDTLEKHIYPAEGTA